MGSIQSSRQVFETFQTSDFFMWGVLLKCYVWNRLFEEAITLYHEMLNCGIHINRFIFPSVLRAFSGFGDQRCSEKIHGRIIKCGFDKDAIVGTSLLGIYGEMGCLINAQKVFDALPMKDVVSWSSLIECFVEHGEANQGLEMFRCMVSHGFEPDLITMLSVAEACGDLGFLSSAKSVHGFVMRKRMEFETSLHSSLIVMYGKCADLLSAEKIFRDVAYPPAASWTALISCYNQKRYFREALDIFKEMQLCKVEPNLVTVMGVLYSCASLGLLKEGKSVYCFAIRKALDPNLEFLGQTLLDLYSGCGKLNEYEKILHTNGEGNIVLWNMLIAFYAQKGLLREALVLFSKMQTKGIMPDSFCLASSLSACGSWGLLKLGDQINCHIFKRGYFDDFVTNSLIDMYCKCGSTDSACMIFDKLEHRSVVAWNSMMFGLLQNGYSVEAIRLFDQMYLKGLKMDEVTFLSIIQACSQLGYLEKGKWAQHKLIIYGVDKDIYLDTALTDMYAKCGDLQAARRIFDNMLERSIVSWSVMIAGYGMHGDIGAAKSLFNQMLEFGIKPNDVTFMNILSACSHSGSVEEGKSYFSSMRDLGIEPSNEHFACIIDLLSRAGDLNGAYQIIKSMPPPVDASIWGALINGCRIHQRTDMFESIQRDIADICTDDAGYYTLISNIYAEEGNWDEFRKVRIKMKGVGVNKVPGYSSIEIDKQTCRFGAGDTPNPQMKEILLLFGKVLESGF